MTHRAELAYSEDDRELIRLAGKAAGLEVRFWQETHPLLAEETFARTVGSDATMWQRWLPLEDGEHALRLAVKLKIDLTFNTLVPCVYAGEAMEPFARNPDPFLATCRAIVREAAEIGREMP